MERVYVRGEAGALVARAGGREGGKRYSDIGRDPDGATRLLEWPPEESARRDLEEHAHAEEIRNPAPRPKTKIEEIEERLAALEGTRP